MIGSMQHMHAYEKETEEILISSIRGVSNGRQYF